MSSDFKTFGEIMISAPPSRVWQILTDPQLNKLWLFEDESVQIDAEWKTGGNMRFYGRFHDLVFSGKGHILNFEPYAHFSYDFWNSLSDLPDVAECYFIIDFRLQEHKNMTKLSIDASNLQNEAIQGHWNFYWQVTLDLIRNLAEKED